MVRKIIINIFKQILCIKIQKKKLLYKKKVQKVYSKKNNLLYVTSIDDLFVIKPKEN